MKCLLSFVLSMLLMLSFTPAVNAHVPLCHAFFFPFSTSLCLMLVVFTPFKLLDAQMKTNYALSLSLDPAKLSVEFKWRRSLLTVINMKCTYLSHLMHRSMHVIFILSLSRFLVQSIEKTPRTSADSYQKERGRERCISTLDKITRLSLVKLSSTLMH